MRQEVKLIGYPSSGYAWVPTQKADSETHEAIHPQKPDDFNFGGQVISTFVYDDLPVGTTLTFNYVRLWENDPIEVETVIVGIDPSR